MHRENVSVRGKLIQPKYHRVCLISPYRSKRRARHTEHNREILRCISSITESRSSGSHGLTFASILFAVDRLLTLPRCSMIARNVVWWIGGSLRSLARRAEKLLEICDSEGVSASGQAMCRPVTVSEPTPVLRILDAFWLRKREDGIRQFSEIFKASAHEGLLSPMLQSHIA